MKVRRSFLTTPGELRYGVRTAPKNLAQRMRIYYVFTIARLFALASLCFFLTNAFDTTAYVTFRAVATPTEWGVGLFLYGLLLSIAALTSRTALVRTALILSGSAMVTAGASFSAAAIQHGTGWWGSVGYVSLGLIDLLVASYSGENNSV